MSKDREKKADITDCCEIIREDRDIKFPLPFSLSFIQRNHPSKCYVTHTHTDTQAPPFIYTDGRTVPVSPCNLLAPHRNK